MAVVITAVASPKPGMSADIEVPEQVKEDVEAIFAHLTANPGTEGLATFDTKEEMAPWLRFARAYCQTREAGALKIRQLPSKHLVEKNQLRFALSRDIPADGERNAEPGPVAETPKPEAK